MEELTKENVETKQEPEEAAKKKKKPGYTAIFIILAVSVVLLVYLGGVFYYNSHFLPHTDIGGVACDGLTVKEAAGSLEQWYMDNYTLVLLDGTGEEILQLTASDAAMVFPTEEKLDETLHRQNAFEWIFQFFIKSNSLAQPDIVAEYDREAVLCILKQEGLFDKIGGVGPQDAYISEYLEDQGRYEIVPEMEGTLLDEEMTLQQVCEALGRMESVLNLKEAQCYQQPEITAEDGNLQARLEQMNRLVGACITYDWNGETEVVDGSLIHQWLVIKENEVTIDEELVAAYVAEKAKAHDTYGRKRKFTTTLGIELTLPSGAYGWKTDRETETAALTELILAGAVTEREPEYICRGWVKGKDDIGDSYVEADLTNQHLYLYQDGQLVLETDFVSGDMAKGNVTPQGVFGITYKTTNAVLRGRDYETPVNYWMPFNGNIGMHDATWRRSFGGDIYLTSGSHGCINLPLDMAGAIYEHMAKGFPVVCYYY